MAQRTNSIQWRVTPPSAKTTLLSPIKKDGYLSLNRKNPVSETTTLNTAIIPIQLVAYPPSKFVKLPNIRLKDAKLKYALDKIVIGKITIEPTATMTNIFCLSFTTKI